MAGSAGAWPRRCPLTDEALAGLTPARVIHRRIDVGVEAVFVGASRFQVVGGISSTSRMETMLLMLLKPYFQGTTSRIGAPFWAGSALP